MKYFFKILFFIFIFILIFFGFYGYAMYFGAKGFKVKEYGINSTNIASEFDGLKIAHISDIHYGFGITIKDIDKIINDINLKKPDLVLLTGDLVDANISKKEYDELVKSMNKLDASIDKYAIDGNHDHGYKNWAKLVIDCGFININDSYEVIFSKGNESIFLAGVSNNTYSTKKITDKMETISNYMSSEEYKSTYNILLMHEPDFIEDINYEEFDLVLAGHSHNGQVRIPFIGAFYTPKFSKNYYNEHYTLKDTNLYISSGIGTSELPVRLFNKPSYNFYRIKKTDQ
ncbi:MAG: metallophosphoesterase [Bacilli bacterium]